MISDRVSPMLASRLNSFTRSMSALPSATPPLTPNVNEAAEAALEVLLASAIGRVLLEARIAHPRDAGVLFSQLRDLERVLRVTPDAEVEGLQPRDERMGVERAQPRPEVAEALTRALPMNAAGPSASYSRRPW